MKILQPGKLYLPAMIIVAIVVTLLVFIGFSTYWNLNHAKSNALNFLHQRGVATIEIIETSIRSLWGTCAPKQESIDQLINEVGKNKYVTYAYMVNKEYEILHHSRPWLSGTSGLWLKQMSDSEQISSRTNILSNGEKVYEIAERIKPFSEYRQQDSEDFLKYHGGIIVIGLNMSTYEMASQKDFQHAIVMLSILAVLGGGAFFFIFVIHLYHRMNHRLRQTQEYTRQVVDSMANGLLSIDNQGRVLSYNNLAIEFLGIDESENDQINLNQVIDFKSSGITETLHGCVSIMDREIIAYHHYCGKIPLAISVTPILIGENVCEGAVIILRDLREIKLLEDKVRHTEKLAALGKLSAAVAHEIRNPLSSIRGFAKFLSHALKDRPKDQEYADVMVKEVDRINRVVTDLLNFASPRELILEEVNPAELVAHAIRLVEGDAQIRGVTIEVDTEESPLKVYLDPNQITQVLLNLLLNALQAIGAGHSLSVGVAWDVDSSGIFFWVEDDGPGIAKDHLKKIFDPFFTKREKGTGLGLAIVQKLVENHHGTVQVISPLPDKIFGCRFNILIPMDLKTRL